MAADEVLESQAFYSFESMSQNSIWPRLPARPTHMQSVTQTATHALNVLYLTSSVRLTAALATSIHPSAVIPLILTTVCCLLFKISMLCNFNIAGTYGLL